MAITIQNVANAGGAYPCGVFKIPGTLTQLQAVVLVDTNGDPISSTGGGPIQDGVNSAILATVKDYSNSNPLATVLVDTNGDPYTAAGSSGVQYTEGDVDASVTGTAVMWRGAGDVMTPVDATNRLPVSATGTVTANAGTNLNTSALALEATLQDVEANTSSVAATVKSNGTTWDFGLAVSGFDGTNTRGLKTDTNGELQVDVLTMPAVTVTGGATAANQTTEIGLLTTIDADTSALAGTVSGSELQVDIVTMPAVTVTGVATAANQATEITSLQLLDDAVATTASAITTKGFAASGTDGTNARILKTDTNGELQVDVLTLPSNASVNVAQMNGVTVSMGNGSSGTGVQRVTLADNSTGVLATVSTVTTVTNITNQGQLVDNAPFTDGTTRIMMNGYIYDEVAGTSLTENDGAAARINVNRSQVTCLEDGVTRGRYATVNASNQLAVAEGGAALTALQLIDDGIATTGSAITTKGMAAVGTDGTNARILKTDTSGELQVDVLTLPANASVNVAQINGVTTTMGNGASGTGVQRVTIASDSTGQINLAPQPSVISTFSVQITGTTSQQVIAAPGSNVKIVLWSVTIANFTATDQAQLLTGSTRFDFVKILANTSLQLTYPRGCTLGNNEAFNFDSSASADWFVSGTYSTISV